jgi:NAD(P)H dehydrogenase (quinone)
MFYSMCGHIHQLARAVAEGVAEVEGVEPVLRKVKETLPDDLVAKLGGAEPRKAWQDVPEVTVADVEACDAMFIGTPTRFGGVCAQVRQFLDSTGGIWAKQTMLGKIGAAFTSSGTQHGGQEVTIYGSIYPYFLHQGMLVAGLPYAFQGQSGVSEVMGGSPYGASCVADSDGSRQPSKVELDGARYMGRHVAQLTKKLRG